MDHEQKCKYCGKMKRYSCFNIDDRGGVGKTCTKCREANARKSKFARDRKLEERSQNTLPLNSGLSEEELDKRLAAAVRKAVSSHNAVWTLRY